MNAWEAAAVAVVEREKVIARSKVAPAAVRDRVVEALRARGFEVTAKVVRVPIADQLEAALQDGSYLGMKTLTSHVRGAPAAEVRQAAVALAESGRARRVLRTTTETLVPVSAHVVAGDDLAIAAKRLSQIAKQFQSASKKGKGCGVLREDIEQALASVLDRPRGSSHVQPDRTPNLDRVLRAIDAAKDVTMGLSFVPKVIGLLSVDLDLATAHRALLEADSRGLVELRPEGGLSRLTDTERKACPEGPRGTCLSWVRRIEVLS